MQSVRPKTQPMKRRLTFVTGLGGCSHPTVGGRVMAPAPSPAEREGFPNTQRLAKYLPIQMFAKYTGSVGPSFTHGYHIPDRRWYQLVWTTCLSHTRQNIVQVVWEFLKETFPEWCGPRERGHHDHHVTSKTGCQLRVVVMPKHHNWHGSMSVINNVFSSLHLQYWLWPQM